MSWETILANEKLLNTLISIGILLLFLLFRKIFIKYIYKMIVKISSKSPTAIFTEVLRAFEKPLQWLFVIVGVYVAVDYFPYLDQHNELFVNVIKSSVIVMIVWGLANLTAATSMLFTRINKRGNVHLDKILIPFISKGLRIIIIAIGLSIIIEQFGYKISGFVAGLGLGGLAFALAAQDALSNLFGGFVIITERPFTIGDWIDTPTVEGTVENITFRSTIVRTFAQGLVTIPNSTLANEPITNWSKRESRRAYFTLEITYEASTEQLKNVVQRITTLLESHSEVYEDSIYVAFTEFNDDGAEIMLYFFTKTAIWAEFLKIKEGINLDILDILAEEDVALAVPSRRLYMDKDVEKDIEL